MRKILNRFFLTVIIFLILIFFIKDDSIGVLKLNIKSPLIKDLSEYDCTIKDIECDDFETKHERQRDRAWGSTVIILDGYLRDNSLPYFCPNSYSRKLTIIFRYKYNWMIPEIGRGFYLHFKTISWINIKLIDENSQQLIGEIEYERAFFESLPPDIIETMLDELRSKPANIPVQNIQPKSCISFFEYG